MSCADCSADLIQSQFIIDILEEEIAAVELPLFMEFKVSAGTEIYIEGRGILLSASFMSRTCSFAHAFASVTP